MALRSISENSSTRLLSGSASRHSSIRRAPIRRLLRTQSLPTAQRMFLCDMASLALRFSKPLLVTTVTSGTVTFSGPAGNVATSVVPAEGGMLAFVAPQSPLLPGTNYGLTLSGLTDANGNALAQTIISFTTAGTPDGTAIPLGSGPGDGSGSNGVDTRWQKLPPLQAPRGITALAGQSLQLNGSPVEGLTLTVEDQKITTKTDGTGRFLLKSLSAGHHVLFIDGTTASKQGRVYGTYEVGVDISAGKTNVLPYTIWMTELDVAHAVRIPSPTTGVLVIGNPSLPGLQLHIPSGTAIIDHDGKVVTEVSITPIPLNQPPFPVACWRPSADLFHYPAGCSVSSRGAAILSGGAVILSQHLQFPGRDALRFLEL